MLRVLEMTDGSRLIVETQSGNDSDLHESLARSLSGGEQAGLPDQAEAVSTASAVAKAARLLDEQISGLKVLASKALRSGPTEVTIEAHIAFAGGVEIIPFLAKATGEGGLKLTLKWDEAKGTPPEVRD